MIERYFINKPEHFNLKVIRNSGQCFRMRDIGDDWYSIIARDHYAEIRQQEKTLEICTQDDISFWEDYFDLNCQFNNIPKNGVDDFVDKAIKYGDGMVLLKQDTWETLISFIISQRKSISAIESSIDRLCKSLGEKKTLWLSDDLITFYYAFPTPEQILNAPITIISSCGVGYRDKYIKDAARWYIDNKDKLNNLTYSETINLLMTASGVGKKVANCVALFGLQKNEGCPVDTWIQKVFDKFYGGTIPDWATSKNAGILQQYVFYYIRNHKSLLTN